MTTMSTISYLDDRVDRVEEMTSLVSKDVKTIEQLTGLHELINNTSNESIAQNAKFYRMSLESIGRQSRMPHWDFSVENVAERPGFLKRAWEMFKRFVRMIVENVQKVWKWIKDLYSKSEFRRNRLLARLKAQYKLFSDMRAKSKINQQVEIALGADQVQYFVRDTEIPEHLGQAVADMTFVMNNYRTSKGLGAAIAVLNSIDDQSLKKAFGGESGVDNIAHVLSKNNRANLDIVYKSNWFKPQCPPKHIKMNQGNAEYPVEALIGDRVIMYRSISLSTDPEADIDSMNFGYRLVRQADDALNVNQDNSYVRFNSVDEVIDLVKDTQNLLNECANTISAMKEVERMVNRVTSLGVFLESYRMKEDDPVPESLRPYFQGMRAITGVMNTVLAFQPAMFAHGVRTAGAITSLLDYTHKRMTAIV